jgi:hypothetical protein
MHQFLVADFAKKLDRKLTFLSEFARALDHYFRIANPNLCQHSAASCIKETVLTPNMPFKQVSLEAFELWDGCHDDLTAQSDECVAFLAKYLRKD